MPSVQDESDVRASSERPPSLRSPRRERIGEVAAILSRTYGDPRHHNRQNPLDELLLIVLSTLTQEANYLRTFRSLKLAFPRFANLETASTAEIADAISSGGLSQRKATAIRAIIDEVVRRHGRLTLAPLSNLDDAACESFLTSLPIVGLKTARCVMMYSLGRAVFPVDTHCWRISQRLGWIRSKSRGDWCTGSEMDRLQSMIPQDLRYGLHVNFLAHGRAICRPRAPRCEECVLAKLCPSRAKLA